jgi:hypothetical protein
MHNSTKLKIFVLPIALSSLVMAQTQIKQYKDPDSLQIYYVLDTLPKARVVMTKDTLMESGRMLFRTDRLRKLDSTRIEVECVWYEFKRDNNPDLKRTEFIALVTSQTEPGLWDYYLEKLGNLKDVPHWLSVLNAMCSFNKSNLNGIRTSVIPSVSSKYVPEINGIPIKMVTSQNGWIVKVGK